MSVRKLCCQGCGASLNVDDSIRFLSCNYCGARLEIVRDATTTHSKLLDQIRRNTGDMAGDLKVIRLQNELEQVDREWEAERSRYLITSKEGKVSEPSAAGSVIVGVLAVAVGILGMSIAFSRQAPAFLPLLGLLYLAAVVVGTIYSVKNAGQFKDRNAAYHAKRSRLLGEIGKAKSCSH